ncbi:DUF4214 domain-containing protein [Undibacterium sp. Ji50W]|uniref:DUF4214 domain-containing protein n=1 Tax=Undibacterium sp. Ji50W TaxID=3413041 RepID=UPI003BF0079F
MTTANDIQNLYIAYFNRPADVAGLAYWQTSSMPLVQIAQSFSQQVEYASAFTGFTTKQTVNALYANLFNHNADSAGLAYWVGQIDSGAVGIGAAAIAILGGATGADQTTIQAKNVAATAFTTSMTTTAQAAYNSSNGSFSAAKAWLAGVVDASTGAAAIGVLATTTNSYKLTGGDTVTLGTGTQTANLYNTSGSDVVVVGGPNQSVNQVAITSGSLNVTTSNANTSGLIVNGTNAIGGASISLIDAGHSALSAAALKGVRTINLSSNTGEVLTLSPGADLIINQAAAAATLIVNTPQNVAIHQALDSDITLGGTANYTVSGGSTGAFTTNGFGEITANGTGGSLKVIDTPNNRIITSHLTITSSLPTTIDANNPGADFHFYTLAGNGNFTVMGAGLQTVQLADGGLKGDLNVVTTGSHLVSYFEESIGIGAVTFTAGGTGGTNIKTNANHNTTINAINGVDNFVTVTGTGKITYNGASDNAMISFDGAYLTNINLTASGNGSTSIFLNSNGSAQLGAITSALVTITNFKASPLDQIHWRAPASSLNKMNIVSSDLASLANNIQSSAGTLTSNDNKAFIVNVASGTAAGTYLYEHINNSTAVTGNDLIVKLVGAGMLFASDLM